MTELEELRAENERLKAGEDFVRKLAVGMYCDCIKGVADAAIITQQHFDVRHVAAAVRQLSELSEGWRKENDRLKDSLQQLIKELSHLQEKTDQKSRSLVENGEEVPEEHRAKAAGYAAAYSYCLFSLQTILERSNGRTKSN
jgi:hypothetical protein